MTGKGITKQMSSMQQPIVKQANTHFTKGDFERAKACYQQAAQVYGHRLFANSIRLCDLRLNRPAVEPSVAELPAAPVPAVVANESQAVRQLEETQQLLEHYYTRCQELEYQLIDTKTGSK